MNYYLASAALKAASLTSLTRGTYRALAKLRASPKAVNKENGEWLLSHIPSGPATLLELGTGWISAYSLAVRLTHPECRIDCFDVHDIRYSLADLQKAVKLTQESYLPNGPSEGFDQQRLERVFAATSIDEAYEALGLHYQVCANGLPDFPARSFDCIFSIDVLEHIDAAEFRASAEHWAGLLKPGGVFLAQVGLVDHTSYWCSQIDDKRYLEHSDLTWRWLLQNKVQYINRLTASEIVDALEGAGLTTLEQNRLPISTPHKVHLDYAWQQPEDAAALRLRYRGILPKS